MTCVRRRESYHIGNFLDLFLRGSALARSVGGVRTGEVLYIPVWKRERCSPHGSDTSLVCLAEGGGGGGCQCHPCITIHGSLFSLHCSDTRQYISITTYV